MSNPFNKYQTDVLFLLVGANPLPNYVAARLLARKRVVLLHSKNTTGVAERLAKQLRRELSKLEVHFRTISESDGPSIASEVEKEASSSSASIGLNYTGGTKPMAVYSYRSLFQKFPKAVFSYLDARTLSMVIVSGSDPVQRIPVGRQVQMKLDQIASLHGYAITGSQSTPLNREIATAIAEVHLSPDGMKQWRHWLSTGSSGANLPDLTQFPSLKPAIETFVTVCGGTATGNGIAHALGFQDLKQCNKYFVGGWLEDYVLDALIRVEKELPLDDCAAGIQLKASGRPNFELDAALTIGYQLFAISCIVTHKKSEAKEHLLEIFVRAGQLGGDEARFAAVTFCDDKAVNELKSEVTEAWDAAGKIWVFGSNHIKDLYKYLLQWFCNANQEML